MADKNVIERLGQLVSANMTADKPEFVDVRISRETLIVGIRDDSGGTRTFAINVTEVQPPSLSPVQAPQEAAPAAAKVGGKAAPEGGAAAEGTAAG